MSGMALLRAAVFLASAVALVVACQSRRCHPFVALVIAASAFGFGAGFSVSLLGKTFGAGFAAALYSPGLVIVAAGLIAGVAEGTGACHRLIAAIDRCRRPTSAGLTALTGLIAGIGASPASAFALLTPLLQTAGDGTPTRRPVTAVALALALSASHGLVLLAPVPIAAAAILGAPWFLVAAFGLPVALLLVVFGVALAHWLPLADTAPPSATAERRVGAGTRNGSAVVLLLAMGVPLLMLMVQSLGDIPSEPLGGGSHRELILGIGRPLLLFLVGVSIIAIGQGRQGLKLITDTGWTERVLGNVAGVMLIVGAAGGLQRLCQESGMAELVAEPLLGANVGVLGGLLIPFLIAATIKSLHGSSLAAAITAAGMVQPMLAALGLGDADGKALAALAVGAGAMTVAHVNDPYFWLVTDAAGLRPLTGMATITLGTLLQGLAAVLALVLLSALVRL
jgi:gluconate:H+ symporter, GntP family